MEISQKRNSQDYKDCLPDQVKKVELTASVADNQNVYYLVDIYGVSNEFWPELIQVNPRKGCTSLISKNNLEDWPSQYLPMKLARELALQMYTKTIQKAGGKKAFQQSMLEDATEAESHSGVVDYLPPEYAWALQQLGIRIPSSYKIIDPKEGVPQL